MRLFLNILCLTVSMSVWSQDYRWFNSDDTVYFKTSANADEYGKVLTVAFDSVTAVNGDSIYYPFRFLHYNDLDTTFDCPWIWTGNWLGNKIIDSTSGNMAVINGRADTLLFKNNASVGESFQICSFDNGDPVIGTVTGISLESFLNFSDSVKTIRLNSANPYFKYEDLEIRISKSHGLVSMVPLFNFPYYYDPFNDGQTNYQLHLEGQEGLTVGIQMPTYFDINNLEIGDKIVYTKNTDLFNHIYNLLVLSKTIFPGDFVSYQIESKVQTTYYGTSQQDPGYTEFSIDTISQYVSISDQQIQTILPGQTVIMNTDETHVLEHSVQCGFRSTIEIRNSNETIGPECRSIWHMNSESETAISGAFGFYHGCWNVQPGGCYENVSLSYKSNSDVECGTPYFLSDASKKISEIQFYPNPTSDFLNVLGLQNTSRYYICTADGKIWMKGDVTNTINVSALNSGFYILILENELQNINFRFFKN